MGSQLNRMIKDNTTQKTEPHEKYEIDKPPVKTLPIVSVAYARMDR